MIPALNENGELPEGEHVATLDEVAEMFGSANGRRTKLMSGLIKAAVNFQQAGVKRIWIDGSFVTDKQEPNDIDGCWQYDLSVNDEVLDPVFLQSRQAVKEKYYLDFIMSHFIEAGIGKPFPEFFQLNRENGVKGIIVVELGD